MKIIHRPSVGIELAGKLVPWGTSRQDLQERLGAPSKELIVVHKISKYLPGAEDVVDRKDIYANYFNHAISFATIYDNNGIFTEFELHEADQITVADIVISFKAAVPDLVNELKKKDYVLTALEGSDENILINALLTNFASSRYVGGDGDLVRYVYCSRKTTTWFKHSFSISEVGLQMMPNPYLGPPPLMTALLLGFFGAVMGALLSLFSKQWKQFK